MKTELYKKEDEIIRVLGVKGKAFLIIDCTRFTMPVWVSDINGYERCDCELKIDESVDETAMDVMHHRYTIIAPILPFIGDEKARSAMITKASEDYQISKQTIRSYLCAYLVYQDIKSLLPKRNGRSRELTSDEKNMRWALNKYYYNHKKNSLKMTYKQMLKEKYCDKTGILPEKYPSFAQFRYFFRKTKKMQNLLISRNGKTEYQRNSRPCLGDGVQEYAPAPGTGMVDATVCDIYLVNDTGQVVGRPILTACVDAYSGLCMGYSLSWEGGFYSVRNLMLNVISSKKSLCEPYGITISDDEWPTIGIPGRLVTDQGKEYIGDVLEHLTELGVTLVNLPPYRPDLKGTVERFFGLIQGEYKQYLKGKGVIEPDFQERGAHDYRLDACLTLSDFEKIILHCIIHYNTKEHRRGIYSGMMLEGTLKEHCLSIQHQAEERMDVIVEQMARAQGIDERLKASDQMQWVRMMNNIRVCAEESVLKELIYS